jgi:hypothetical protein
MWSRVGLKEGFWMVRRDYHHFPFVFLFLSLSWLAFPVLRDEEARKREIERR